MPASADSRSRGATRCCRRCTESLFPSLTCQALPVCSSSSSLSRDSADVTPGCHTQRRLASGIALSFSPVACSHSLSASLSPLPSRLLLRPSCLLSALPVFACAAGCAAAVVWECVSSVASAVLRFLCAALGRVRASPLLCQMTGSGQQRLFHCWDDPICLCLSVCLCRRALPQTLNDAVAAAAALPALRLRCAVC